MEEISETVRIDNFHHQRVNEITELTTHGTNPYPHKFQPTMQLGAFRAKYDSVVNAGDRMVQTKESIAGRIKAIHGAGKLYFMTIRTLLSTGVYTAQLAFDLKTLGWELDRFKKEIFVLIRGDIVGACGYVGKTHKGELTLFVESFVRLTPCLHMIPTSYFGITNSETRARRRDLDLIVNDESIQPFIIRNRVFKFIRQFLDDRGFMEVQTPVLCNIASGANAKPFETFHNDLKQKMHLRISPELRLKELVVGGIERVYELGIQFRNESEDDLHQPSFWSVEFYMAYADYNDLMALTEEFFSQLTLAITGSMKIKYVPHGSTEERKIDFTPPYKRLDMLEEIEKGTGVKLPNDLTTEEVRLMLIDLCHTHNVICGEPKTTPRMLDKLAGKFVEPQCNNPTFVINHPLIMSPLAKWHRNDPNKTERFELFVCGFELCNAYTELNNPFVQRDTFQRQMQDKANGDDEAQEIDEQFVTALEVGLPPTGGWGAGVDRLVMLLSNRNSIRDVTYFPTLRPEKR